MEWKDTGKPIYKFYYDNFEENRKYNRTYTVYYGLSRWTFRNSKYLYPKSDLDIESFETKTIKPDSKLFFDPGSGFPRFKLSLSGNKRCIKQGKADVIVVSGDTDYSWDNDVFAIIEDDNMCMLVDSEDWGRFNRDLNNFVNLTNRYIPWNDPKFITESSLQGFNDKNMWIKRYDEGIYTLDYITDINLDKIINDMCPDFTVSEIESIIEMLNSEDTAVVQLGVKTLQAYNISKYKMTLRLILCSRSKWYTFTKNTVGTKQILETLDMSNYDITDSLANAVRHIYRDSETYDADDIALAKRISKKLIEEYCTQICKTYFFNEEEPWLPDERTVSLS